MQLPFPWRFGHGLLAQIQGRIPKDNRPTAFSIAFYHRNARMICSVIPVRRSSSQAKKSARLSLMSAANKLLKRFTMTAGRTTAGKRTSCSFFFHYKTPDFDRHGATEKLPHFYQKLSTETILHTLGKCYNYQVSGNKSCLKFLIERLESLIETGFIPKARKPKTSLN